MPIEAASETDRAIGVIPAAPWRVKGFSILPDYRLAVTFQDGTSGVADFSAVTSAHDCGIYEPLKDPSASNKRVLKWVFSPGRTARISTRLGSMRK